MKVNIAMDRQVLSRQLRQACSRQREQQAIPGLNFRLYQKRGHYLDSH